MTTSATATAALGWEGLLSRHGGSLTVLVTQVPATATTLTDWALAPCAELIARLRDASGPPARPLAVVWVLPERSAPEAGAHGVGWELVPEAVGRAAAVRSLRGIVQSLTRETAHQWPPLNGIVACSDQLLDAAAALDLLAEHGSAYLGGAVLDLADAGALPQRAGTFDRSVQDDDAGTVLVTGAAGAIGGACVQRLTGEGRRVVAVDLDASRWDDTAGVVAVSADLLSDEALEELQRLTGEHEVSSVIAAHGVPGSSALAECTPSFVTRVLDVNARSIPRLFAACSGAVRERRGSFVVVASQAGLIGEADNSAYCAAKSAVVAWATAMDRLELTVNVTALCPGPVDSPLLLAAQQRFAAAAGTSPREYYTERMRQIAAGRYGRPEDIAAAAHYLVGRTHHPSVLAVTGGDVLGWDS